MRRLHKAKIIESKRGPNGGHKLIKDPKSVSVKDVIDAVEYSLAPFDCVDLPESCILSHDCSQKDLWTEVEQILLKHLSSVSIYELSVKYNKKSIRLTVLVFGRSNGQSRKFTSLTPSQVKRYSRHQS